MRAPRAARALLLRFQGAAAGHLRCSSHPLAGRAANVTVPLLPRLSRGGLHVPQRQMTGTTHVHDSAACSDDHTHNQVISHQFRQALYAGSFDPPSNGHLDIIRRALQLCDKLVVAVAVNPKKNYLFTNKEREDLVRTICESELGDDSSRVEIVCFDGLVVDFAEERKVNFLVRGLRAFSDFEYEFRMALINRKLTGIETSFLMADERMSFVSSSLIREVAVWGKMLPNFVPESIAAPVFARLGVPYGNSATEDSGECKEARGADCVEEDDESKHV